MSITYVGKNGRVYKRKFDHEDARRRYEAGESVAAMAREFGVHETAVWRVVSDRCFEADRRATEAFLARNRVPCEGCGELTLGLVAGKKQHNPDGRILCRRCRADEKIERLQFDIETNDLVAVRCVSLDCANGERWQSPDNFPRGSTFRWLREGGFHGQCRACLTRARREYRRRNPDIEAAAVARARERRRARAA